MPGVERPVRVERLLVAEAAVADEHVAPGPSVAVALQPTPKPLGVRRVAPVYS